MTFKAFSTRIQGKLPQVLRPDLSVWTLAFGLTAFGAIADTAPVKSGTPVEKPSALCAISHAGSKAPQTCPAPAPASTGTSAQVPSVAVAPAVRRAWLKAHSPLPTGTAPDDAVAMKAQNPGTDVAFVALASPGVVALAIRDKAQELSAPKPQAEDNNASGAPHSHMAQVMSLRDAATTSAIKSNAEELSAPKPQAVAEPQTMPSRGHTQTRGMASGQDVASLGLADERNFRVKGLGVGQSLSAFDVAMPALVHQILANDVARGGVSEAAPPPEETTPDFLERVALSRQLMQVDGTDDLIRHLVNTVHMKLVVGEVNKYLNINSLPERDRYRLSAIVASTATELSDRILNLNARTQARMLTKAEFLELITALDVEPQKKLTRLRLEDDGSLDKQAELEIQLAQLQIIKKFERR